MSDWKQAKREAPREGERQKVKGGKGTSLLWRDALWRKRRLGTRISNSHIGVLN